MTVVEKDIDSNAFRIDMNGLDTSSAAIEIDTLSFQPLSRVIQDLVIFAVQAGNRLL